MFFIKIEHGPTAPFIPIALHRFFDRIIFGLERASFDNSSIVLFSISSDATSKTEVPKLMSEITSFPPLLSSDIALSILTVKVLFILIFICLIRVISLKQNLSILLYEKESILNSILQYQISKHNSYDLFVIENDEEFLKSVKNISFDACILNFDDFSKDSESFANILRSYNKNISIIAYHKPFYKKMINNVDKLFLLEKPFKLITLLNYLDNINKTETLHNSYKYLMDHIIFSPSKKTISNIETNYTEHLTEKENNLLIYFYNNKNEEILKKDLLTKIWGFSEKINTHTLETHIYRLKQKLNKIDKNLSLLLRNRNGIYYLK